MLRQGVIVAVLVALAGCTSKTSIVGTWKYEMGSSTRPPALFMTFNPDGTYHEELMYYSARDYLGMHGQGTYRLEGDRLTIDAVVMRGDRAEISKDHTTSTVSILGNSLSIKDPVSADPISFNRVDEPPEIVDHSLDLIGRWKNGRGENLRLTPSGQFTLESRITGASSTAPLAITSGDYIFDGHYLTLTAKPSPGGRASHPAPDSVMVCNEDAGPSRTLHFPDSKGTKYPGFALGLFHRK